jgi:hypothetical protein
MEKLLVALKRACARARWVSALADTPRLCRRELHCSEIHPGSVRVAQLIIIIKMSAELPESKREISEADWQALKQEALHWVERVTKGEEGDGASRSYDHILNNLCLGLTLAIETADNPAKRTDERYDMATKTIDYIRRYFQLLEDFPDFAEKELKPGGGYFPEMMNQLARTREFIDAYEERLRGPKGSNRTE